MEHFWEASSSIATIAAAILAATGLLYSHWQKRDAEHLRAEQELRKTEVLNWSQKVIEAMQTIVIITSDEQISKEYRKNMLDLSIKTSILIEEGRLFFKNMKDSHELEKEQAYQGFRPEILDQILIAHIVAKNWEIVSTTEKQILSKRVSLAARRFVTLAQKEVGRDRTASADTANAGMSINLNNLLRAKQNWPY